MIEINTLYVAVVQPNGDAKFATLSAYKELGGRVWRTRSRDEGGTRYSSVRRLTLELCESKPFSRKVCIARLPEHWANNVNTDRFWLGSARIRKLPPLAWKFMPNEDMGTLNIEFCDFSGEPAMAFAGIPLNLLKPLNN